MARMIDENALGVLPPGQRRMVRTIHTLHTTRCINPTVRDLQEVLNIKGPNGVYCHLKPLKKKGFVDWEAGKSRTLRNTDKCYIIA